jgi:peptide/nickel transport system ATP-binding protein
MGCATSSIPNGEPEVGVVNETVPLLEVADLTVEFSTRRGVVRAVEHVDVRVAKGETVGIVGESGSGKSVTSYAVMRILDRAGRIAQGAVRFTGLDVRAASENEMRDLRGREMSMIFQNPRAALNPIRKIGRQIEDVLEQHSQADSAALTDRAIEMLDQVRIATMPIPSSSPAACASAW